MNKRLTSLITIFATLSLTAGAARADDGAAAPTSNTTSNTTSTSAKSTAPDAVKASEANAETHSVRLTRPFTVGQKMQVKLEGSQDSTSTPIFNGVRNQPQLTSIYIKLSAEVEVLAVDDRQRVLRAAYKIQDCAATLDGHPLRIAPVGATVIAERRGDTTSFLVNDRDLGPQATEALRIIARLEEKNASSHDDLAGTPSRRAIGERWSIDMKAAVDELGRKVDEPVDPSNVSGTIHFPGLSERGGHSCLFVETELSVRNWLSELPPGFGIKKAKLEAIIRGLYPEDETLPPLAESHKLQLSALIAAETTDGDATMEFEFELLQRIEREVTPLGIAGTVVTVTESADAPER